MNWGAAFALAAIALPAALACGGATAFPEPAICATPTAVPSVTGRGAASQYFAAVRLSVDQLSALREQLRAAYPGDKFSRDAEFRIAFANYADTTNCVAQGLRDIKPPSIAFEMYDADLDAALQALIEHTAAGREAVRRRNVSDYRAWYREADLRIDAVKTASTAARMR